MSEVVLKADVRQGRGKGYNNKLREEGLAPGVIYGKGMDGAIIQVNSKEIQRIISSETGRNTIINIEVPGLKEINKVMIRDVQKDPVKGFIKHVDFYQISLKEKININVPIHITGEPEGVKAGGILQQGARELEIECLPTSIPDNIEVDITNLNIGENITVADIKYSGNFEVISDTTLLIVSVLAPRVVEEEPKADEGAKVTDTEQAKEERELVNV